MDPQLVQAVTQQRPTSALYRLLKDVEFYGQCGPVYVARTDQPVAESNHVPPAAPYTTTLVIVVDDEDIDVGLGFLEDLFAGSTLPHVDRLLVYPLADHCHQRAWVVLGSALRLLQAPRLTELRLFNPSAMPYAGDGVVSNMAANISYLQELDSLAEVHLSVDFVESLRACDWRFSAATDVHVYGLSPDNLVDVASLFPRARRLQLQFCPSAVVGEDGPDGDRHTQRVRTSVLRALPLASLSIHGVVDANTLALLESCFPPGIDVSVDTVAYTDARPYEDLTTMTTMTTMTMTTRTSRHSP